jgi:integral membrane protein
MTKLMQTPLGRFRLVSIVEGLSYALLVFVAMPLKYGLDLPQMVRVIGMVHGLLFITFVVTLVSAATSRQWSASRAGLLFAASMVPLGALWIERSCSAESA